MRQPLSPLKAAIIGAGFAHNEYLLEVNRAFEDPAPRYPRSRMFQWPVTFNPYEETLSVCHMLMTVEPFVQRVMLALPGVPVEIEPDPPGCHGVWNHAGDLATDRDFLDLLATRVYVPESAVMRGIALGVRGARLSTANARAMLAELDKPEPDDRSAFMLSAAGGLVSAGFIDDNAASGKPPAGKGKWVANMIGRRHAPAAEAWAVVHGVEDRWFKRDKHCGWIYLSPTGLSRHMGVPLP